MIVSYSPGRVRIRLNELKNPIVALAVKKRMQGVDGIREVMVKQSTGSLLVLFDPEILPPEKLFARGRAELEKYNIRLALPETEKGL